jgi:phospho-N-acetylmuramoyl-pentapeptide-transferase
MMERALVGLALGFVLAAALGPFLIRFLRDRGLQTFHWLKSDRDNREFFRLHGKKSGTPAMGGLLMLLAGVVLSAILYPSAATWVFIVGFLAFSALGLLDDLSKAAVKAGLRKDDLGARPKFVAQWALGLGAGALIHFALGLRVVTLPLVGAIDFGVAYVLVAAFVLVTTANAANITDGLDGLLGGLSVIGLGALAVISLIRGNAGAAGLATILIGATLGFMVYNVHPARVFMGDVGSMGLGFTFAYVALLLDALLPLLLIAGVLAVELLSSLIQRIALRRGRKVFRIAPLHHHFEAIGWPETRITPTFWTVGLLLGCAGVLASLI